MQVVKTPESNLNYQLPGGTEKNDLPCEREVIGWYVDHPIKGRMPVPEGGLVAVMHASGRIEHREAHAATRIRSVWELDTDELAAVTQTHRLALHIYGEPVPPVALGVISPADRKEDSADWEPPVARAHLARAITLLVEKLKEDGFDPAPAEDVLSGLDECLLATAAGESG